MSISGIYALSGKAVRQIIIIISLSYNYHIIDHKRQNCLKVGTDKPKLKVKTQSVSDEKRKDLLKSHIVLSWR